LLSNTKNFEGGGKLETFYIKGDKNKVDKTLETSADGKDITETIYKDGNIEQPEQQTIKQGNDTTVVKYDWFEDKLNSKTTSKGNDVETVIYKQVNGEAVPERIVSSFKSDPNSVKSIVNKFNDDYKVNGQTVEYSGAKIGEGLIKEDIDIAPETGNKVAEEATFSDGTKQYYQTINGELEQVGKDKDGNHFVVLDVPEGWSMDKIANEFGITKEDLLKANTDKDGNKLYHTNKKGVEYFYINDKAIIPKPNKIPQDSKYALSYELPNQEQAEPQKEVVENQPTPQPSSAPTTKPASTPTQKEAPTQAPAAKSKVTPHPKPQQEVNNKPASTPQHIHKNATENKKVNTSKPTTQAKSAQNNQQQKVATTTPDSQKVQTKTSGGTVPVKPQPTTDKTKTNTTKTKTKSNHVNTSATVATRAAKAKRVAPEYHSSKFRSIQKPLPIIDPRVTVKKSRNDNLGMVSEKLTEYNLKNTMCNIVKKHDCTLTSALLREYSKPKKTLNGQPYKYDKTTVIQDLAFLKQTIQKAEEKGYKIPPELYAYIPPKTEFATPARIQMEIQAYETVFGKGSANYHIPS